MHLFLSYAKSHIYDIHAVLVAVITIITMNYIKNPIKQRNRMHVDERLAADSALEGKRRLLLKRANFILLPLTMVLAFFFFAVVSVLSPMISFSAGSAVMSGVFALAGYALWEQFAFDARGGKQ